LGLAVEALVKEGRAIVEPMSNTPHAAPEAPLRLVVMGTGPFAVPMFRALIASPHHATALVTRPDRPARLKHGKQTAPHNPMRQLAQAHGVPVFEPESINRPEAVGLLEAQQPDLLVVCDYGQILSQETLAAARLGGINLHGSLLPKYRGAAPVQWALYHGELQTGVSVIHMTPRLDAGPVLVQRMTPIGPDETAPQLEARLAELGAAAVLEAIALLASGKAAQGIAQDARLASRAPRLKKSDGQVDWRRPAAAIYNQFRAMQPWPTTFTFLPRQQGEPLRLILVEVRPIELPDSHRPVAQPADSAAGLSADPASPGTIFSTDDRLLVACGQGALRIDRLQPAGKRVMTAAEFLRGHPLRPGMRLGNH
jgi:methionyl-tRNA formyltransferase